MADQFRAAVITASDKGSRGERQDESGPLIEAFLQREGYKLLSAVILPDDQTMLQNALIELADVKKAHLILTTGGTGFSLRDCMPEATLAVASRLAPGIAEALRSYSLRLTKRAMLSRAVSVIRGKTLIINLPGSPRAVSECLAFLEGSLKHALELLSGNASECAR